MQLQILIDLMIDQALERDPAGSYTILLGAAPATEMDWATGKKVYRWCPVAQSRLIPNYTVVLAPSPDNARTGDLVEYQGRILNGSVTRLTLRKGDLGHSAEHDEAITSGDGRA
jgi:hypothetical protein